MKDLTEQTERVLQLVEELHSLTPQEAASLFIYTGLLLANENKEALATILADAIIKASYGTEEQQIAFSELGQAYAFMVEAVQRDVYARRLIEQGFSESETQQRIKLNTEKFRDQYDPTKHIRK